MENIGFVHVAMDNCAPTQTVATSGDVGNTFTVKSQESGVCPSCGYCPHCGRGGHHAQPYYPLYPIPWFQPWGGTVPGWPHGTWITYTTGGNS